MNTDKSFDSGNERIQLDSFEQLFKLYHRKVYAICLRMTGEHAEAEDLMQEVFIQLFRKLSTFRGESAFSTWLYRLTVNQVLMHFRKIRKRKEQLTEDGELPESNKIRGTQKSQVLSRLALDEAVKKLPQGYRAVFLLHDVEGLEHNEIATLLGCSTGTSKSQLHKARLKLRSLLNESEVALPAETKGEKLKSSPLGRMKKALIRRDTGTAVNAPFPLIKRLT